MFKKAFNILAVSDIHLGHSRTSTESIIANLDEQITNDKVLCNINFLCIVGDLFDSQLTLSLPEVSMIDRWIAKLLRMCQKYDIILRVLEGTPSHDRGQSERFTTINEIHEKNSGTATDLQYVKTLSIEHNDKLGIDILYVPDEWNATAEETLIEVKELMTCKMLDSVDYAFMHGNFHYQLPSHIKGIPRHDEEEYQRLVKHKIYIGHIHKHTVLNKIIAQGSFDRLSHGEEEPKGFIITNVEKDGTHNVTFIENVNAKKYITVDCFDTDIDNAIKRIDRRVNKLPIGSNVRVRTKKDNAMLTSLGMLKSRWPQLTWTTVVNAEQKESIMLVDDVPDYIPVIINKTNISDLIRNRLIRNGVQSDLIDLCNNNLNDVK